MKKSFLILIALFALAGILNCAVVEPAFAYEDHCENSCQDESDCADCSACHFLQHQWESSQKSSDISRPLQAALIASESNNLILESPQGSIFHPPILI